MPWSFLGWKPFPPCAKGCPKLNKQVQHVKSLKWKHVCLVFTCSLNVLSDNTKENLPLKHWVFLNASSLSREKWFTFHFKLIVRIALYHCCPVSCSKKVCSYLFVAMWYSFMWPFVYKMKQKCQLNWMWKIFFSALSLDFQNMLIREKPSVI